MGGAKKAAMVKGTATVKETPEERAKVLCFECFFFGGGGGGENGEAVQIDSYHVHVFHVKALDQELTSCRQRCAELEEALKQTDAQHQK